MTVNSDSFKDLVLELLPIVEGDAERALEAASKTGNTYDRRMAYRAVFAALDGSLYVARQLVLSGIESQIHRYSSAEVAILKEENYLLGDSGKAYSRPRFLPIDANIRFVMEMVVREADIPLDVDWTSEGWSALKSSLEVRHRVTHPRSKEDLEVSEEELRKLNEGFFWVRNNLGRTLARALLAARHKIYGLLTKLLPEDVTAVLDETDPELESADVHVADKSDLDRVFAILSQNGLALEQDGRFVLSLHGKDYVRWRKKPPEEAV